MSVRPRTNRRDLCLCKKRRAVMNGKTRETDKVRDSVEDEIVTTSSLRELNRLACPEALLARTLLAGNPRRAYRWRGVGRCRKSLKAQK